MSDGQRKAEARDLSKKRGSTMVGYQRYVKFLLGLSWLFLFGCAALQPNELTEDKATAAVDLTLDDAWQVAKATTACQACITEAEIRHAWRMRTLRMNGAVKQTEIITLKYVDETHIEVDIAVLSDPAYGLPNAKAVLENFHLNRERWAKGNLTPPADLHSPAAPVATIGYVPLIDLASIKDLSAYQRDIAECGQLARAHTPPGQALDTGAGSALAGAGFGALLSHILGGSAGRGAAAGSLTWGTAGVGAGAVAQETTYQTIYRNCMTGRGWHVLR